MSLLPMTRAPFVLLPLVLAVLAACEPAKTGKLTLSPAAVTLPANGTATFTATPEGGGAVDLTWTATGGTVTQAGIYTAPATPGTYVVTAFETADPDNRAIATVKVHPDTGFVVWPSEVTLDQGEPTVLSATLNGESTPATWTVDGSDAGTVSPLGTYTAPWRAGTDVVTATSDVDPSLSATVTVRVRAVAVAVRAPKTTVPTAGKLALHAVVTGTLRRGVTWSVREAEGGSVTHAGLYTAPTTPGTFTVVATAEDGTVGTFAVSVVPVAVSVNPAQVTLDQGATQVFAAIIGGTDDARVTWRIEDGEGGTIDARGLYTAPAYAGTFTVRATSVADATKSWTATVVVREVSVAVSPQTVTLAQGEALTFTATVSGTVLDPTYTWEAVDGGTIDATGRYVAPSTAGTYTVVMTSAADPTKSATATVTVPVAQGLDYVDPEPVGWRFVKNAAASTTDRLVLDLVGPAEESGRGVALTLSADTAVASWTTVSDEEATHVANQAFSLGEAPQLLQAHVASDRLTFGVFQKGHSTPATAYEGPLVSIALSLASTPLASGTPVALAVVKAHALPATGDLAPLTVTLGTLLAD